MTTDALFSPNFSRKLTGHIFSRLEFNNIARPSKQQLSSCYFRFRVLDEAGFWR